MPSETIVISGGARGADRLAENLASARGLKTVVFHAKWDEFGKKAGFIRNQLIVDYADKVVAFWDSVSPGTHNTIELTLRAKKPLVIYHHNGKVEQFDFDKPIPLF